MATVTGNTVHDGNARSSQASGLSECPPSAKAGKVQSPTPATNTARVFSSANTRSTCAGQGQTPAKPDEQVCVSEDSHFQSAITGDCRSPYRLGSSGVSTRHGRSRRLIRGNDRFGVAVDWLKPPRARFHLFQKLAKIRPSRPMGTVIVFIGKILHTTAIKARFFWTWVWTRFRGCLGRHKAKPGF